MLKTTDSLLPKWPIHSLADLFVSWLFLPLPHNESRVIDYLFMCIVHAHAWIRIDNHAHINFGFSNI